MPTVAEILRQAKQLADLGQWESSLRVLVRGLQEHPQEWSLAQNASRCALFALRVREAIELAERAIQIRPDQTLSRNTLANALISAERFDEAAEAFRSSLEIDPNDFSAHLGLSAILEQVDDLAGALEHADRAIELDPQRPEGYANKSFRLRDLGDLDRAIDILEQAERASPGDFENHLARVSYLNYSARFDAAQIFQEHVALGRRITPAQAPIPSWKGTRDPDRKLRVGILSSDLRTHSVAFFIEPLLRHFDRQEWHLIAYADHANPRDLFVQKAKRWPHDWKQIGGKTDPDVARILLNDQLDVLIELNGWTLGQRLPLLAQRLAPLQIDYLGYPNTTGVPAIDFRIVDEITDPPGSEALATERLLRLPGGMHCFQPPEFAPPVNDLPALQNGFLTFGSFNTLMKVNAESVATWAEILRRVPDSRLILKTVMLRHSGAQARIQQMFEDASISADRVELLPNIPDPTVHLGLYHRIDLALDTFPYNGTTTTCDALWMGVPVVSFAGDRHASRVTASQMTRVGLADWVGSHREEMIEIAVQRAHDLSSLQSVRKELRDRMAASPLASGPRLAQEIQAAVRAEWRKFCQAEQSGN